MIWLLACTGSSDVGPVVAEALSTDGPFQSASECVECHPTQVEEWESSMHAYSETSPVFKAMRGLAEEDHGFGEFCDSCHSPLQSEGIDEGVTCDVCHTATSGAEPPGSGSLEHRSGLRKHGPYSTEYAGEHLGEQSDFVTSSELCGACHDITLPSGLVIEETYTEFLASPASESDVSCQACHMGDLPGTLGSEVRGVSGLDEDGEPYDSDRVLVSHRFVGPDYSLVDAWPYPDDLERSAQVQADNLARVEELIRSSAHFVDARGVESDGVLNVELDLESTTIGHRFPTGFTSERQVWIQLTVFDGEGASIFQSGDTDAFGDLRDEHSLAVESGSNELDEQLVHFQTRNYLGDEQLSLPLGADRLELNGLDPGEVRTLSYAVPMNSAGPYTVRAQLMYRNLPFYVLRELGLNDYIPRIRTFTVDFWESTL